MKKSKVIITIFILSFVILSYSKVFASPNGTEVNDVTISSSGTLSVPSSYCSGNANSAFNFYDYPYTASPTHNIGGAGGCGFLNSYNLESYLYVDGDYIISFDTNNSGGVGCTAYSEQGTPYCRYYVLATRSSGTWVNHSNVPSATSTSIKTVTSPLDESIQASTTVTFSGTFYVASSTIATTSNVFMYLYVQNRSNDTATSSLNDYTILNFPVTALNTTLSFSTTTVLTNNARFAWTGSVRRGDMTYGNVPFSDGKAFYQFTTGSFDPSFGKNFDLSTCNPFSGFDIATCLYNLIVPNNVAYPIAFNEAKEELGRRVPWGYVTRVLEILTSSTTASTMPTIDYSFASSSPMSAVGNIHFEPFTLIAQSGTLINEMKSDRSDSKTVWEIFMPFINMFIYIVLLFMIIHDLTGIHSSRIENDKQKE